MTLLALKEATELALLPATFCQPSITVGHMTCLFMRLLSPLKDGALVQQPKAQLLLCPCEYGDRVA